MSFQSMVGDYLHLWVRIALARINGSEIVKFYEDVCSPTFFFYTKRIKSNFDLLDAWMVNSLWSFLPTIALLVQYFVLRLFNFPPVVTQKILFLWKSCVV